MSTSIYHDIYIFVYFCQYYVWWVWRQFTLFKFSSTLKCKVTFEIYIPYGKLTWQWQKSPRLVGKSSSTGPWSIAMLVYWSVMHHGNLRYPPQCHPPQQIRPYWGTINHWFPLIRPAIRAGYFLGGVVLGNLQSIQPAQISPSSQGNGWPIALGTKLAYHGPSLPGKEPTKSIQIQNPWNFLKCQMIFWARFSRF